jgi:pyruvate dehydrogenase E2 component (dihydrolipoyllysine-residue acetyltransferase)
MATDVVMPQMGESVAEGTIVRWIKKVGDTVERDEPLFEISTDKVDAEIPSPAAGVLTEIRANEGQTVEVNTVVAVIGEAGAKPAAPAPPSKPAVAAEPKPSPPPAAAYVPAPPERPVVAPASASAAPQPSLPTRPPASAEAHEAEIDRSTRSSPLVRKIAKEHNVDIRQIHGTGISGRVTKDDILAFIGGAQPAPTRPVAVPTPVTAPMPAPSAPRPATSSAAGAGLAGQTVPMSVMRRKIAEHMITSRRTSAHVHSVFEVNFGQVEKIRQAKKNEYERAGAKLTYLSFILL